jgi:multidrug efflux pump subunit AcrA (membrane-fusion protein)
VSAPILISSSAVIQQLPKKTLVTDKTSLLLRLGLAVVIFIVIAAIFQPWKLLAPKAAAAPTETHSPAPTVKIARPAPATTASVTLPATIRPWQTTTLYSRVTGYLKTWEADLGAPVKAGQVLAVLETPELDQEVAAAQAQAAEAAAAMVQAQAELTEAELELKVAIAQLARVRAEVELSRSQLARREKLLVTHAISQEEFETAQRDLEARTADIAAAESDVARRRSNLKTRAAIIEVRQATAASKQSNVERLKELQAFKRIVAPFDGIVTSRTAEIGMLVAAGAEPLFTIQDMNRVRIQVQVPQTNAAAMTLGDKVLVSIPESKAAVIEATVTRFASSIDSVNRTMLAEIELMNQSHSLQPGSYAQVTLTSAQDSRLWTVPSNTIQMRVAGPHVAVVNESNRVTLKPITLGRDLGSRITVASGIQGNERLIVNPRDDLVNGTPVSVDGADQVVQR